MMYTEEDIPHVVRQCRDWMTGGSQFTNESIGIVVGGPAHGKMWPIDREDPNREFGPATYHLTDYEFGGEKIAAWRCEGLSDFDAKGMLIAMIFSAVEEFTESL